MLIRHAVNDFVKTGRLAGWTPEVHLNDEGKAQAAALGTRLADVKIDAIYSSPLERTVETAQAVIQHHPELQLQTLDDVGEVRYGTFQGGELSKLSQRKLWGVIQNYPSRVRFPNGEAMRDTQMRAVNALERLVDKHPRGTVAVVSHSDVIKMIVTHYLGLHLDLFQRIEISPTSLTILELGFARPVIVQVNETTYLPQRPHRQRKGASLTPVESLVIDAIGEPGNRTFYLQAKQPQGDLVSIALEKTQAMTLAEQIPAFLSELSQRYPDLSAAAPCDLPALQAPSEVLFRAGKLALKYNALDDLVGLDIQELKGEDQGPPEKLRLWATRSQMATVSDYASQVAANGLRTDA